MSNASEYWFRQRWIVDEQAPITWAELTRSTEPMWRSEPINPTVWHVATLTPNSTTVRSSFSYISWDDVVAANMESDLDPNMRLPEGF